MPRPLSTRGLVEGALFAAVLVLLVAVTTYIPLSGIVFAFFWPVPIALLYLRYDSRLAILTVIVSTIILSVLVGPVEALDAAFLYGPVGIAFGHAAKRRWSVGRTVALGAAAVALATFGTIAVYLFLAGQSPADWLGQDLADFAANLRAMEQSRLLQPGTATRLVEQLARIPWVLLLFTGALTLLINFQTTRVVLTRLGYQFPALPRFADWRFPAWLRLAAAVFAATGFSGVPFGPGWLEAAVLSLAVVAVVLLVVQGLAILDHILASRGAPALARGIFGLLLLTFRPAALLLAVAATIDAVFDLRCRLSATGKKEDKGESHPHSGCQELGQKGERRRGS